jgi:hypothetical protein
METVLFLDVDGVLNRCGHSRQRLEEDKVARLGRIIEAVDPLIVVSSSWRISRRHMGLLTRTLEELGGRFGGITPVHQARLQGGIMRSAPRGEEIQAWIDHNDTPSRFVIVDDGSDMAHLMDHLVQTEWDVGLTDEHVERIIRLLS